MLKLNVICLVFVNQKFNIWNNAYKLLIKIIYFCCVVANWERSQSTDCMYVDLYFFASLTGPPFFKEILLDDRRGGFD